jgi:uncharacterized phage-associated protein
MRGKGILSSILNTKISALDVAKYFLSKANREGDWVTNLKMQKLLYYAQAWYLVNYNAPLFKEPIRPWALGPVIKEVYDEFKNFGSAPIDYKSTGQESNIFSKKQKQFLDEFYDIFFKFTAHELVNMSHNESPWKDAFEKRSNEISLDEIKRYYTHLLETSQKNAKKR